MHYYDFYPKDDARIAAHQAKQLGETPLLHSNVIVHDSHIGSWTELGANTWLSESTFGDYSYTAGDVQIIYADVGKFCSIASHVRLNPGNHPMWRVTQHHITYRRGMYGLGQDDSAVFAWRREQRVRVGHDVWLGHGALVMPGVAVGTGAVVGAGAVVTKDVEPYTVVVGVPAKPIRKRFDEQTIATLLKIAYWDWERETLAARFDDLYDTDTFIAKYG